MTSPVAERALAAVGTPFRLYGRKVGVALDCVGLVLHALNIDGPVRCYSIKGAYLDVLQNSANQYGLQQLANADRDGDIVAVDCGQRQQHLLVRAQDGWVHAHAGLRRVVHMPGQLPWPLLAAWRLSGA